jgi:hypothetical protein
MKVGLALVCRYAAISCVGGFVIWPDQKRGERLRKVVREGREEEKERVDGIQICLKRWTVKKSGRYSSTNRESIPDRWAGSVHYEAGVRAFGKLFSAAREWGGYKPTGTRQKQSVLGPT